MVVTKKTLSQRTQAGGAATHHQVATHTGDQIRHGDASFGVASS